MNRHKELPGQLGFDALLSEANQQNKARKFERETAHLPATMEDALPFYRDLLEQHHATMLIAERDHVLALREEAHKLPASQLTKRRTSSRHPNLKGRIYFPLHLPPIKTPAGSRSN